MPHFSPQAAPPAISAPSPGFTSKPGAWTELALTLPVFLAYQLGVVFLDVRNATDVVTARILDFAHGDRLTYLEVTSGVGLTTIAAFALLGRGQVLRFGKVAQMAIEGTAYAIAMGAGTSWVVGKIFAGVHVPVVTGVFSGIVMSLGAGFYEELAFRVLLFGVGGKALLWMLLRQRIGLVSSGPRLGFRAFVIMALWAICSAAAFRAMHYWGALGDAFDLRSFVARSVLGLVLTVVYAMRGFAAAVWTHALYDFWVLAV